MKSYWTNRWDYDDPIIRYERGWFGGLTPISLVLFDDPQNPPYLTDRNGRQWTWEDKLESDGNSTPQLFRAWLPANYCEPAPFLHDAAYRTKTLMTRLSVDDKWQPITINREQADDLIMDGWDAAAGDMTRNHVGYRLLRLFGWMAWKGKR